MSQPVIAGDFHADIGAVPYRGRGPTGRGDGGNLSMQRIAFGIAQIAQRSGKAEGHWA